MGWTGIARRDHYAWFHAGLFDAISMALIMNLHEIQVRAGLLAEQSGGESGLD